LTKKKKVLSFDDNGGGQKIGWEVKGLFFVTIVVATLVTNMGFDHFCC
jgi:hypothetical protein